jgi:LPXTG-motif cell wall-anchored protein
MTSPMHRRLCIAHLDATTDMIYYLIHRSFYPYTGPMFTIPTDLPLTDHGRANLERFIAQPTCPSADIEPRTCTPATFIPCFELYVDTWTVYVGSPDASTVPEVDMVPVDTVDGILTACTTVLAPGGPPLPENTVATSVVHTSPSATLPQTGSGLEGASALGVVLALLGAALVATARRRSPRARRNLP